jgi:uncharacterized membrane protein YccC
MQQATRQGLRAAVAAAIAIAVSRPLALPRSYWAIVVAVVLVGETWGEGIQRALQRLGMTAAGCVAGALVHVAVSGHPRVETALLFAGVFFASYFRQAAGTGSYPWMIFFITVYVVFLFASVAQWDVRNLVLVRIADTFVGCVAALAAAAIVRPTAANARLERELRAMWTECRALVASGDPAEARVADLFGRVAALRAQHAVAAYEHVFATARRRRIAALVRDTAALLHASISLVRALGDARRRPLPPGLAAVLDDTQAAVLADLDALLENRARRPAGEAPRCATAALCARLGACALSGADFAVLGAVLDHAEEVEDLVGEIGEALASK